VHDKRGQPPILLCDRYLPVSTFGVERGYDLRRSDLAQRLVDRRHGVRIADRETVQIAVVASDAHASRLLGDADDGTRHRTDGWTYEGDAPVIPTPVIPTG